MTAEITPKKFDFSNKIQEHESQLETLPHVINLEKYIEFNDKGGVSINRSSAFVDAIANLDLVTVTPTYPLGVFYDNKSKLWKTHGAVDYLSIDVLGRQLQNTAIESTMTPQTRNTYSEDIMKAIRHNTNGMDDPFNLADATTPEVKALLNLVPFSNGTYDFRTNEIRPHDQKDYITAPFNYPLVPYDIENETIAPLEWLTYLTGDSVQTLCEYIGYSFLRTYSLINAFLIATDDKTNPDGSNGRNGKSATFSIIEKLLQTSVSNISTVSSIALGDLTNAIGSAFILSELRGKYASIDADASSKFLEDTSKLKKLTGGDKIRSDVKYSAAIEFKTHAKLYFGMNDLPNFSDDSDGFQERMLVVPFIRDLRNPAEKNKANELFNYQNPNEEDLGKLAWYCIQQFRKLSFRDGKLNPIDSFTQTDQAKAVKDMWKSQNNVFSDFWKEFYIITDNHEDKVSAKDLREEMSEYLQDNGYKRQSLKTIKKHISKELTIKSYKGKPNDGTLSARINGKVGKIYRGIKLVTEVPNEADDNEPLPF